MSSHDKPLVWLHGEVRSPPMPIVGRRCHELRIIDFARSWRLVYRIDPDAIVIVDVFAKKTQRTPLRVIEACRTRLGQYDHLG